MAIPHRPAAATFGLLRPTVKFHALKAPASNMAPIVTSVPGEVSSGHYIHLIDEEPRMFLCAATTTLAAIETSCEEEPTSPR